MRILVATGSSGGHISPALGFLDALKDKNIETLLVLPKRSIVNQIQPFDYKVDYISISPIKLSLDFNNFFAILKFFKGFLESIFILLFFRPYVVVGFGSLTCVPLVMSAWLFRIRTLIHEQNVVPGRANRFLARFTDKITISFTETKSYFKGYQEKIVLTGNPMRKDLILINRMEASRFFGFTHDKFTILVMGGSLGSHSINVNFLKTISSLSDKYNLQVIHISGLKDYDFLKTRYRDLKVNIRLFSFLKSMQYAYSASDLVVSRAGATSIAEMIFFRIPAIIVPYPYAYKHQLNNAKVLEKKGCAIIIQDNELDADILTPAIIGLINNSDRLKEIRSSYDNFLKTNANDLLLDEVLSLN
jgi:UDP-N-acetylglucosamine--N-acetylmuramyl-(pentapeptide) pyrophosphoryl-undecaprenol N-acetylglucosamine transferase